MPARAPMIPSSNSSRASSPTNPRPDTPSARSVRKSPRRCSRAKPSAACTMNSPTARASSAMAVRLRWKLSVNWPGDTSVAARVSTSPSGACSSASGAVTRRVMRSPLSSSVAAAAMSITRVSGGSLGARISGGSRASARRGSAPGASRWLMPSAGRVSGATRVCHGGVRNAVSSPAVPAAAKSLSPGRVKGSMPITVSWVPSGASILPSSSGETGRPARRRRR